MQQINKGSEMNEGMYVYVHVFANTLDFLGGPYLIIERNATTE